MRRSSSYNFFEILLSALSWAIWIALIGILLGGKWYGKESESTLTGIMLLKFMPRYSALIISFLAIGLLFAANIFNNIIKFVDTDRHNLLFQSIVLGYGVIYLVLLFVITFDESIAWYPMSFFICYMVGGICDILFARFYNNSGEWEPRERRYRERRQRVHRIRNRHQYSSYDDEKKDKKKEREERKAEKKRGKQHIRQIKQGAMEFAYIIDSRCGAEAMRNVIKDAIHYDSGVEFDEGVLYSVKPFEPRLNKKRRYRYAKYFDVNVGFSEDAWQEFLEYADMINGGNVFMEASQALGESGLPARYLRGKALGGDVAKKAKDIAAIVEKCAKNYDIALSRLKEVVTTFMFNKLGEYTTFSDWRSYYLGAGGGAAYFDDCSFLQIKKTQKRVFDITTDYHVNVDVSALSNLVEKQKKDILKLFIEKEQEEEKNRGQERYIIIDSDRYLARLATHIRKYFDDHIREVDRDCGFFAKKVMVKMTPNAEHIKTVNGRKVCDLLDIKVYFDGIDRQAYDYLCSACSAAGFRGDSDVAGNEYIVDTLAAAINDLFKDLPTQYYKRAVMPSDASREYWTNDTTSEYAGDRGELPIEIVSGCQFTVTQTTAGFPKDEE